MKPRRCRTSLLRWGILWRSINTLDGDVQHIVFDGGDVLVFKTRREARAYIASRWDYIRTRNDLRREPHGWRAPKAVRVRVTVEMV